MILHNNHLYFTVEDTPSLEMYMIQYGCSIDKKKYDKNKSIVFTTITEGNYRAFRKEYDDVLCAVLIELYNKTRKK